MYVEMKYTRYAMLLHFPVSFQSTCLAFLYWRLCASLFRSAIHRSVIVECRAEISSFICAALALRLPGRF